MTFSKKMGFILSAIIIFSGLIHSSGPGVSTPHKEVQRISTGALDIHLAFAPKLHVDHGCQPHAAVDDIGNYSAGLRDSGRHNGQCNSSDNGQVYARSACKESFCGHMFVYYMPKDNGFPFPFLGHRHDFEEIVIWTKNGNIIGAAYSAHGDYRYHNNPYMSDNRVNPSYDLDGFTHAMQRIENSDKGKGTVWPVASWELMTQAAKNALSDSANFPNTNFAAKDTNFIDKINEARLDSITVIF